MVLVSSLDKGGSRIFLGETDRPKSLFLLLNIWSPNWRSRVFSRGGGGVEASSAKLYSVCTCVSSCLQPAEEHGLIDGIDSLDAYIERNYGDTVR